MSVKILFPPYCKTSTNFLAATKKGGPVKDRPPIAAGWFWIIELVLDSVGRCQSRPQGLRSEEHTSELQSLMRISYAVFCLKKKKKHTSTHTNHYTNNT